MTAAIIVLGPSGLPTAIRLKEALGEAEIHGAYSRLSADDVDQRFEDVGQHLRALYQARQPLLVIAAAAIPIRLLAPVLDDKHDEPPVLAIAEDGSAVVPLLGGHRGANDFSRRIGDVLGQSRRSPRPAISASASPLTRRRLDGRQVRRMP